jgi:preprotein translocase subunit SecY
MFSAFANSLKIPELRSRILYTLSLLFIARVGAHIPLPGIDPKPLLTFFEAQTAAGGGGLMGLYNMFTGGALLKGAVCALGIMPYISASIIFQLMTAVVPALSRLQQEGDVGRQKLTQYTRYLTVVICLIQAVLLVLTLENPGKLFAGYDVNTYGQIVIMRASRSPSAASATASPCSSPSASSPTSRERPSRPTSSSSPRSVSPSSACPRAS